MQRVYQFVAAPTTQPPQALNVYTTELDGQLVGLLTDPPSDVLGPVTWNRETTMLHHVGSVTKSLLDSRLRAQAGLAAEALDDLTAVVTGARSGTAAVVVDGYVTRAQTLRLNGLEFALADDLETDCYAIARQAGSQSTWPELRTWVPHSPT